jgi:large subunit ribosomal protein L21
MFAVIKTGGKQYRVEQGDVLEIEKLAIEAGKKVTFDEVLLVDSNGETLIGTPYVDKAQVKAVVLESFKDQKVIVFKKKRRKQYKRKTGHRQQLTRIKIEEIMAGGKVLSKEKLAEKPKPKAKPKVEKATPAETKAKVETEKKKIEAEKPKKTPVEKPVKKDTTPKAKEKVKAKTADKPKSKAPAKKKAEKKTSAKPKK